MDQLYKLEVHYGGTFQYIPQLIYSGGTLNYVDYVIPKFTKWSDIGEMLWDLDYEESEKIYYREHMQELDTSLRLIYDDASVEMMFKVKKGLKMINLDSLPDIGGC